jgi:hypothetical protein
MCSWGQSQLSIRLRLHIDSSCHALFLLALLPLPTLSCRIFRRRPGLPLSLLCPARLSTSLLVAAPLISDGLCLRRPASLVWEVAPAPSPTADAVLLLPRVPASGVRSSTSSLRGMPMALPSGNGTSSLPDGVAPSHSIVAKLSYLERRCSALLSRSCCNACCPASAMP